MCSAIAASSTARWRFCPGVLICEARTEELDDVSRCPILSCRAGRCAESKCAGDGGNTDVRDFTAKSSGRLAWLDAGAIGRASVALGAGRAKSTDAVDFAVGFDAIRKTEERLEKGDTLFRIHARDEATFARALEILEGAVEILAE